MGDKETGIKIKLKPEGFKSGLKRMEDDAESSGKKIGSSLSEGMKSAAKGTAAVFKGAFDHFASSPLVQLGGFGALLGIGDMAKDVQHANRGLREFAFDISKGKDRAYDFGKIQSWAREATRKWGVTTEEATASMRGLYDEVGDSQTAIQSLDAISAHARGTGMSMGQTTEIAGGLIEQFGIGARELPDALAATWDLAKRGGVTLDDVSGSMGRLGRAAKLSGVQGTEGMKQTLLLANALEDSAGGGAAAIDLLATTFGKLESSKAQRKLLQAAGIKTTGAGGAELNGMDLLQSIMKQTGGDVAKLGALGIRPEQAQALSMGLGGGRLAEILASSGGATLKGSDIARQATEAMDTPEMKMQQAMNKIKEKLAGPEVTDAIGKLTDNLPKLADVVVKVVGLVADHPLMAGALIASKSLVGADVGSLFGGKGGGKPAAAAASSQLSFGFDTPKGTPKAGFNTAGAGGAAGPIAAAALVAYTAGREAIDDHFLKQEGAVTAQLGAGFGAANLRSAASIGTPEASKAARAEARTQLADIDRKLDEIDVSSTGGVGLSAERRAAALDRISHTGNRSADERDSLLSQRADLQAAIETPNRAAIIDQIAAAGGMEKAMGAGVDLLGAGETGFSMDAVMKKGRGRRGALNGALGQMIAANQDEEAASAQKAADVKSGAEQARILGQIQTASETTSRKLSSQLDVRVSNIAEITAGMPGYVPR